MTYRTSHHLKHLLLFFSYLSLPCLQQWQASELYLSLLDVKCGPCHIAAFVHVLRTTVWVCVYFFMCVYTYVFIHACWCGLQRTSGWHYIIWGPEGVLNLDMAWSSSLRQQECQRVGVEPLSEQNPAARKPQSSEGQHGQPASQLSLSSSLL